MPYWDLTLASGEAVRWSISHYETDGNGVVLSFAVELEDGTNEVCTLTPTHVHKAHVPKLLEGALDLIGATSGYKFGAARGVRAGLGVGAAGILVSELAQHAINNWFGDEIDDGNYYDRFGQLIVKGKIIVK